MKRALAILLLMLLSLLGGVGRASDAGVSHAQILPAPLGVGERMELYSYTYLGIEVRPFREDEFETFCSNLEQYPKAGIYCMAMGKRAALNRYDRGIIITRVVPGSPADEAGLKEGEVIVDIGAARMKTPADLLSVMRNSSSGIRMHMTLIDNNYCWKRAMPYTVARKQPAHVGHIIPRKICARHLRQVKQHQARVIELLAMNPVPIEEACSQLEAIARILYRGYTPGCLRIPLRSGDCSITATRCGWDIELIMTEGGVETRGLVSRWVVTPSEYLTPKVEDGSRVLPEAIRQRLQEMDIRGAADAPRFEPNSVGCPIPGDCCK